MVDARDTSSPNPPKHFADSAEPDKIMYIQQPKDMYSACFGGLMATRLTKIGAAGVVIDGRFRDVREIQELGFPVSLLVHIFISLSTNPSRSSLRGGTLSSVRIRSQERLNLTSRYNSREIFGFTQEIS